MNQEVMTAAAVQDHEPGVLVIEPVRPLGLGLREIWQYRDLLLLLAWRDVSVRYKQTVLGALWAIIQPLFTMLVFSLFFGQLARIPSDGVPYPVFSYAALLPWLLFASALGATANSLIDNGALISKIYFPRIVIPVASCLPPLIDFAIAFVVLLALIVGYGIMPGWQMLLVPLLVALALIAALGVGLWLSALNIQYRDFRYAIPFLVQFWMFASPVVYPSSLVPESWRLLYAANPMVGVVEGFRWAMLGAATSPAPLIAVSALSSAILLSSGLLYFRYREHVFADVV